MKNFLPLFILILISNSNTLFASEIININVIRSINREVDQKIILPFDGSKIFKEAWRSSNGIVCKASVYTQKTISPKGSFECESQEGYKAQISIDCEKNRSQETSAYLFFGLVGKRENIGNFYVWCE